MMTYLEFNVNAKIGAPSKTNMFADIGVIRVYDDGVIVFRPSDLIRFLNRPEFVYGASYPFNFIDDFARCIGEYELRAV